MNRGRYVLALSANTPLVEDATTLSPDPHTLPSSCVQACLGREVDDLLAAGLAALLSLFTSSSHAMQSRGPSCISLHPLLAVRILFLLFLVLFAAYRFYRVYRQSPQGPVDPSFRALAGRLEFTVRRHKFNEDYLSLV